MKKLFLLFFTVNFLVCDFEEFIVENSPLNKSFSEDNLNQIKEFGKEFCLEKAVETLGFVENKAKKYKQFFLDKKTSVVVEENKTNFIFKKHEANFIEKYREDNLKSEEHNMFEDEIKDCLYIYNFDEFEKCIKNPYNKKRFLIEIDKKEILNKNCLEIYEKEYVDIGYLDEGCLNYNLLEYYKKILLDIIDCEKSAAFTFEKVKELIKNEEYEKCIDLINDDINKSKEFDELFSERNRVKDLLDLKK